MSSNRDNITDAQQSIWSKQLIQFLSCLKQKNEEARKKAACSFMHYVTAQARELPPSVFSQFMEDVNTGISELVNSAVVTEKLSGIVAIEALIDLDIIDDVKQITRMAGSLHQEFVHHDANVVTMAAGVLGKLARTKTTLLLEFLEKELKMALEWLEDDTKTVNYYSALLLLSQFAENAPSLFYVHSEHFLKIVWNSLYHKNLNVRQAAMDALNSSFSVLSYRSTYYRLHKQWYRKFYATAIGNLHKPTSVEATHGALLALLSMVKNLVPLMDKHSEEICELVLKSWSNGNKMIRKTATLLLAAISKLRPDEFSKRHLKQTMSYFLVALKKEAFRAEIFTAIRDITQAVQQEISPYATSIMSVIKKILSTKSSRYSTTEVLSCLSSLTVALGTELYPSIKGTLNLIFSQFLSSTLIELLFCIAKHIPKLALEIRVRLINTISLSLTQKPLQVPCSSSKLFYASGYINNAFSSPPTATSLPIDSQKYVSQCVLALSTLGSFNFSGVYLLRFLNIAIGFLDHEVQAIRLQSVITCCQLTASLVNALPLHLASRASHAFDLDNKGHSSQSLNSCFANQNYSLKIVNTTLRKVLSLSMSETDPDVRLTIFSNLREPFDPFLAQPDMVRILGMHLYDGSSEIQLKVIDILCRISAVNSAYVMPILRKHLLRVYRELEYSEDYVRKEKGAQILSRLASVKCIIEPYSRSIFQLLMRKVRDSDNHVATKLVEAIGQLAITSDFSKCLDVLIPLIIENLSDQSTQARRISALKTLGVLMRNVFYETPPFLKYPKLLDTLLSLVKTEQSSVIKSHLVKVFGIIGALDPDCYKQASLQNQEKQLSNRAGVQVCEAPASKLNASEKPSVFEVKRHKKIQSSATAAYLSDSLEVNAPTFFFASEDYYPTVAVQALLSIIQNPSVSAYHQSAVQAIMFLSKSLGLRTVPLLSQVMESFIYLLKAGDIRFKDFLFQQLALLVSIVKQYILEYLDDVLQLIKTYWNTGNLLINICYLIDELSLALNDELRKHIPFLISIILKVLYSRHTISRRKMFRVCQTIETLGVLLEGYEHLVLFGLISFVEADVFKFDLDFATAATQCIGLMSRCLDLSDYAVQIVHSLLSVLNMVCPIISQSGNADSHAQKKSAWIEMPGPRSSAHAQYTGRDASSLATNSSGGSLLDILMSPGITSESAQGEEDLTGSAYSSGKIAATYQDFVNSCVHTFSLLMCSMDSEFRPFLPAISKIMQEHRISHAGYQSMEQALLCGATSTQFREQVSGFLSSERKNTVQSLRGVAASGSSGTNKLKTNEQMLFRVWETDKLSTKEDWSEWMRKLSIEHLRESPSTALRSCVYVADYTPFVLALFNVGFLSCWNELSLEHKQELSRLLETASLSKDIPQEILQNLLNLVEFMELRDNSLPIYIHTLGTLTEKCHAYAKAMHYKEAEFRQNPDNLDMAESLISLNNKLGLPNAANGILRYVQTRGDVELRESWYEELGRWEEALEIYSREASSNPEHFLGRMRCLNAMGEWETILEECWPYYRDSAEEDSSTRNRSGHSGDFSVDFALTLDSSTSVEEESVFKCSQSSSSIVASDIRVLMAQLVCSCAWYLQDWGKLSRFVCYLDPHQAEGAFFRAILYIGQSQFDLAYEFISRCRFLIENELKALFNESYQRAYPSMIRIQQLSELEEVIEFKKSSSERQESLKRTWAQRLKGCRRNLNAWRSILAMRALITPPQQDLTLWLKYAELARKMGHLRLSHKILNQLTDPPSTLALAMNLPSAAVAEAAAGPQRDSNAQFPQSASAVMVKRSASQAVDSSKVDKLSQVATGGSSMLLSTSSGPSSGMLFSQENMQMYSNLDTLAAEDATSSEKESNSSIRRFCSSQSVQGENLSVPLCAPSPSEELNSSITASKTADSSSLTNSSGTLNGASVGAARAACEAEFESNQEAEVACPSISSNSLIDVGRVRFAQIKQEWAEGNRGSALQHLFHFSRVAPAQDAYLTSRTAYTAGQWIQQSQEALDEAHLSAIIAEYKNAMRADPTWYKAIRALALINYSVVQCLKKEGNLEKGDASTSIRKWLSSKSTSEVYGTYLIPAIHAFYRCISLSTRHVFQDILRLLTIWFDYGSDERVEAVLIEGFDYSCIDFWIPVIPQIIARILPSSPVRRSLSAMLMKIGKEHPQAIIYSLTMACRVQSLQRFPLLIKILDSMRQHSLRLVDQAELVSQELIRVAILWHEMWYEALEEASKQYFGGHNVHSMLAILAPLHETLEAGAETIREISFKQAFGAQLRSAYQKCKRCCESYNEAEIARAWDIYYQVFRRISRLPQMNVLELKTVSPKLLNARNLELAVPGTYRANQPPICIVSFYPVLKVIFSKHRPRKLSILGSDGQAHHFLLKGCEDLRQDERVMQLFGLINTLLSKNARKHLNFGALDLSVQPYSVIPLSPNTGLLGWVPHCDTLHQLILEYRQYRGMYLNTEYRYIMHFTSDYNILSLMQKVELFEMASDLVPPVDLERMLWFKSPNSEVWLERRTNYTTSLAVMSMVGYILGLGDRHPSNIMLDRYTGKIIHIDFGDCFEVALHREKYPEKVPFRLTRMLVNALDVSGVDGNFRIICEYVIGVLRENQESLMAVLEAFVCDPLIKWRLLIHDTPSQTPGASSSASSKLNCKQSAADSVRYGSSKRPLASDKKATVGNCHQNAPSSPFYSGLSPNPHSGSPNLIYQSSSDQLNERALVVINRVSDKLSGWDFGRQQQLTISNQVGKLIKMATNKENLCQAYLGWVAHW